MDTPPTPLNKIKNDAKLDKEIVKTKLRRNPTSEKSDLYEFKIDFFDNGELEEFFLFVRNCQITLDDSVAIAASAKIQYHHTLLRAKELCQLDVLYVDVGSKTTTHLNRIIFGSVTYFFYINASSKQKRVVRQGMSNPQKLKVTLYDARMIKLN